MGNKHATNGSGDWLRVVRRPDEDEVVRLSVPCLRQRKLVALDECADCEHCAAIVLDPGEQGLVVRCIARQPEESRRAPRPPLPTVPSRGEGPAVPPDVLVSMPVGRLMSRSAVCVRPDAAIDALLRLLLDCGFSGVPVVDEEGFPIGIVSRSDSLASQRDPAARIASDVMTPVVHALPESAPVALAAALMTHLHVHRLPVLSESGRVVGILSALDVLGAVARAGGYDPGLALIATAERGATQ